jgi:hypothetical protein
MNLLSAAGAFTQRLVNGVFKGNHEIAVELTGFTKLAAMHKAAERLCKAFGQKCVYYEHEGVGSLLLADGRHLTLGHEERYPASLVRSPIFAAIHENYTVYADGSAIAAQSTLKAVA